MKKILFIVFTMLSINLQAAEYVPHVDYEYSTAKIKALVQEKNELGMTCLHVAARDGDLGKVKLFIKAGASVEEKDNFERIPLHWAAEQGNDKVVEYLIVINKACIEEKDNEGRTPLYLAVLCRHQRVAQCLLDAGASLNVAAYNGHTMLDVTTPLMRDFLKKYQK